MTREQVEERVNGLDLNKLVSKVNIACVRYGIVLTGDLYGTSETIEYEEITDITIEAGQLYVMRKFNWR